MLSLKIALDKEFIFLETLNYDYAVWDDTYNYMADFDAEYVDSNFVGDTFYSLKIDGVFIYDMNFNMVYGQAYDYIKHIEFDAPDLDLQVNKLNRTIIPNSKASEDDNSLRHSGFLQTEDGPVMFASHVIKRTDKTGEPVGSIVFIKKVRTSLIKSLAEIAQVELSYSKIEHASSLNNIVTLKGSLQGEDIATQRKRVILDVNGNPLLALNIKHHHQTLPVLFDHYLKLILLMFFVMSLLGFYIVNRYFIEPLINGASAINSMLVKNDLQPLRFTNQFLEMRVLISGFNALIKQVKEQNFKLEKISKIDGLTQIYNRRAFDEIIAAQWGQAQQQKSTFAVILLDVDHFKNYNDFYGHQGGDTALQLLADKLKQIAKLNTGTVARYGGEEFILFFKQLSYEEFVNISQQLLLAVKELNLPHEASPVREYLTISAGCVFATKETVASGNISTQLLIKEADEMLYEAKNSGRNKALTKAY
nr:diguanylate cyclase [Pseudoalteromonas sp. SWXJZ94C]